MILLNQYFFTFLLFNACCLFGNFSFVQRVLFVWEHFYIKHRNCRFSYSLNMSSSGTESDSSTSSDVDFDDYGEFDYQLEPEYTEEELR